MDITLLLNSSPLGFMLMIYGKILNRPLHNFTNKLNSDTLKSRMNLHIYLRTLLFFLPKFYGDLDGQYWFISL